jgi:hypothetical protein
MREQCQQQQIMAKETGRLQLWYDPVPHIGSSLFLRTEIGCASVTNVISNTYRTIRVNLYWELMHQANHRIHRTLR